MLDAGLVTQTQDELTVVWHEEGKDDSAAFSADGLMAIVTKQHRANFDLWPEEDKARDPHAAPTPRAAEGPIARRPEGAQHRVVASEILRRGPLWRRDARRFFVA